MADVNHCRREGASGVGGALSRLGESEGFRELGCGEQCYPASNRVLEVRSVVCSGKANGIARWVVSGPSVPPDS